MDFEWCLESFDVPSLVITVCCSAEGFVADAFLRDGNTIQLLALNNNASSGTVSTSDDLDSVGIVIYFKEEKDLKKFCNDFVALQKESQSDSE